jgi:hypothetical protein
MTWWFRHPVRSWTYALGYTTLIGVVGVVCLLFAGTRSIGTVILASDVLGLVIRAVRLRANPPE